MQFFHKCTWRFIKTLSCFSILLIGLISPSLLFAEVYRCVDEAGKVKYSDTRCSAGSQTEQLEIQTNTYDGSPDREAVARTKSAPSKTKKIQTPQPEQPEAEPVSLINSAACQDAMRSYEIAAGSFKKDAEEIASKNWEAEIKCGITPGTKAGKVNAKRSRKTP